MGIRMAGMAVLMAVAASGAEMRPITITNRVTVQRWEWVAVPVVVTQMVERVVSVETNRTAALRRVTIEIGRDQRPAAVVSVLSDGTVLRTAAGDVGALTNGVEAAALGRVLLEAAAKGRDIRRSASQREAAPVMQDGRIQ